MKDDIIPINITNPRLIARIIFVSRWETNATPCSKRSKIPTLLILSNLHSTCHIKLILKHITIKECLHIPQWSTEHLQETSHYDKIRAGDSTCWFFPFQR